MSLITLTEVGKTFREKGHSSFVGVHNISLSVGEGEFFVVVGPSGCGKSTLLRMMSGLETPSAGRVHHDPTLRKEEMSFVFQQFALFPWLTVEENIALALYATALPPHEGIKRVNREIERMGLHEFRHAHPKELSGGLRQRVGIARAFVRDPRIVFLDEPFSELDSFTATKLRSELLELWGERKTTVVMVTHLIEEAVQLADRIAVMTAHPGTIEHTFRNDLPRPRAMRNQETFALIDTVYKAII